MNKEEMEILDFPAEGYQPIVDFEHWRLAVLKFCDDLKPENVTTMQKHLYTDEAFVLVQGKMNLYLGGRGEKPGPVTKVTLQHGKVYNIRKGTWHNHTMDEEGECVIVENVETCDDNSPILPLEGPLTDVSFDEA